MHKVKLVGSITDLDPCIELRQTYSSAGLCNPRLLLNALNFFDQIALRLGVLCCARDTETNIL